MAGRSSRALRHGIALAGIVLAILFAWEWLRRARIVEVSASSLIESAPVAEEPVETIDPTKLEATYRDEQELRQLIDKVRASIHKTEQREWTLDHTVKTVVREIRPQGKEGPAEKTIERVTFRGGKKYRQTIDWIDLTTGQSKKRIDKKVRLDDKKIEETFPFRTDSESEGYRYSFSGIEQIGPIWCVKIAFEPATSPVRRFRGEAWIDPVQARAVRVFCLLAEKKPFLDQLSMLLEYGPVETGDWQLVRSVIDGSGGFACCRSIIARKWNSRSMPRVGYLKIPRTLLQRIILKPRSN